MWLNQFCSLPADLFLLFVCYKYSGYFYKSVSLLRHMSSFQYCLTLSSRRVAGRLTQFCSLFTWQQCRRRRYFVGVGPLSAVYSRPGGNGADGPWLMAPWIDWRPSGEPLTATGRVARVLTQHLPALSWHDRLTRLTAGAGAHTGSSSIPGILAPGEGGGVIWLLPRSSSNWFHPRFVQITNTVHIPLT